MEWDAVVKVSGSDFTMSSSTAANITGLSYPLLASSKYIIEFVVIGTCSSASGAQFGIQFSASGGTGTAQGVCSVATTAASAKGCAIANANTGGIWTTGTDESAYFRGGVLTGANAGNVTVQTNLLVSGTVTVRTGSVLKIKKIA